jgi:hypothetical protein
MAKIRYNEAGFPQNTETLDQTVSPTSSYPTPLDKVLQTQSPTSSYPKKPQVIAPGSGHARVSQENVDALKDAITRHGTSGLIAADPQPESTPAPTPKSDKSGASAPAALATNPTTHGTFNPAAFATNEPETKGVIQSEEAAPKQRSDMDGIGDWLGGLLGAAGNVGGKLFGGLSRGLSAAGGTGDQNAFYMQQKQDYAKELQKNQIQNEQIQNLRNIARDYGINEQQLIGTYGPSGNRQGYEQTMQPFSAGVDIAKNQQMTPFNAATEVEKNREMMGNKFGYIKQLLGGMGMGSGGSGVGYPPGSVQAMRLPNGQPDVKSIVGSALQPGGVANTKIDPNMEAAQQRQLTNTILGMF